MKSTNPRDYQHVARPMAAMPADYPRGHHIARHTHVRHQLLLSSGGVAEVDVDSNTWVVPPGRAVWIPANVAHSVRLFSATALESLYIDPPAIQGWDDSVQVLAVSPLMRALIAEAMHIEVAYDVDGRDGALMRLLLAELRTASQAPLFLPMPSDKRVSMICQALLTTPQGNESLAVWGQNVGAAPRTLSALFKRQTGMTFGRWRQQARLLWAMRQLAAGRPIGQIAYDIGYNSQSAFSAMFRKAMGVTPRHYFSNDTPLD